MSEPLVEYLHMGGYAFYVWCSYAAVLVVLALNLVAPSLRLRRLRRALSREVRLAEAPDSRGVDGDRLHPGGPSGGPAVAGVASRPPAADGAPR